MCSSFRAVQVRGTVILSLLFATAAFAAGTALIPQPETVIQTNAGSFTPCTPQVIPGAPAPSPTPILADGAGRETAEFLATTLFKSTGYRFPISTNLAVNLVPQAILLTTNNALASLGSE